MGIRGVRPRPRRPALAAAVLAFVLASCSSTPSSTPEATSAATSPTAVTSPTSGRVSGGTLRVGLPAAQDNGPLAGEAYPDTVPDPAVGVLIDPLLRCCLTRTLLSFSGHTTDQGGVEVRPDLATDLPSSSDDGLTWTFRIRAGIHYAPPFDSDEVVAADFVRAIERLARLQGYPGMLESIAGYDDFAAGKAGSIAGLATPDTHTLVVRLGRATGDFSAAFTFTVTAPIPPDAPSKDYGHHLAITGPYMYGPDSGSGQPGESPIVLVRNPRWERSTDPLRGAWVDRIELSVSRSESDGTAQFEAGKVDVAAYGANAAQVARYQGQAGRIQFAQVPGIVFLPMNPALPPFDDLAVRRAVNLVIDKAELAILAGPQVDGTPLGLPEVARHAIPDSLEDDLLAGYDPYPSAGDHGDVTAARAAMAASRYDTNHDGRCDVKACSNIPVAVRPGFAWSVTSVRARLLDIGITITPVPSLKRIYDPSARTGLGLLYDDFFSEPIIGDFTSIFASDATDASSSANGALLGASAELLAKLGYTVTSVPSVDGKLAECQRRSGQEAFVCTAELDQLLMERVVPWVPLWFPQVAELFGPRVVGASIDQSTLSPALDQVSLAP